MVAAIPNHMRQHAHPFWEDMIGILLNLVEFQLELGFSVVVDSVFMGDDRHQAYEIASRNKAEFRPIYTHLSDERIWKERVQRVIETAPPEIKDEVATWERIQEQQVDFHPWKPGSALFVNGVRPLESNLDEVLSFITEAKVELEPM